MELITVELHSAVAPFALAYTTTAMLKTDGTVVCGYTSVSGNYYIAIKGGNALQTWSATPVLIGNSPITYDFTTAASRAYGSNMVELASGVFGLYSGDLNQDGNIDTIDYPIWETDSNNFETGAFHTDLNGDGNVDTIDYPIWEANSNGFISISRP